ncbi:MAG: response regulator [Candidatus Dadabacteria bacterium]
MSKPINKKFILWADDDLDDLMIIRHILDKLGYDLDVKELHNGEQVLTFLKKLTPEKYPSLVILDMNMPIISGKEALKQIKADPELSALNVIMFTTSNSKHDKQFCADNGVEMITKPTNMKDLEIALKKLVTDCF